MVTEGQKQMIWCGVFVVLAVCVAAAVLLAMSFSYLDYYEYGFKRKRSTGEVSLETVYTTGRYTFGPDADFLVYKADAHFLDLEDIDVFTHDKLEVKLTAHIQYFLRKDELALIHKQFNVYYEDVVKTSAVDALKGAVPVYSTRELISNRTNVEIDLYKAVRQRLGGVCCRPDCDQYVSACPDGCKEVSSCTDRDKGLNIDVVYFQLGSVYIPDTVQNRFMEALVLQETTLREVLIQESVIVRKTTQQQVQAIQNNASEIQQNATTKANLVTSISKANYFRTIEKARIIGLNKLFKNLNITETQYKSSYDYLKALQDNDMVHLTVDFDQKIAGTL